MKDNWSWIATEVQGTVDFNKALLYDYQFEEKVLSGNAGLISTITDNLKIYNANKTMYEDEQKRYVKLQDVINDTATEYDLGAIGYEEARQKISNAIKLYYPEIFAKYGEESAKIDEIIDKKMAEANITKESSENINNAVDESNAELVESYTNLVKNLDEVFTKLNNMLTTYVDNTKTMATSVKSAINSIKKKLNGLSDTDLENIEAIVNADKALNIDVDDAGKSHSGMELGYIGDNTASGDKKAFKYIALSELDDNEIVRVLQKGEGVVTEPQISTIMSNFRNLAQVKVPILTNNSQPIQSIEFKGDIIVQGVQNVDGLAKAIKTQLPQQMLQELYKK